MSMTGQYSRRLTLGQICTAYHPLLPLQPATATHYILRSSSGGGGGGTAPYGVLRIVTRLHGIQRYRAWLKQQQSYGTAGVVCFLPRSPSFSLQPRDQWLHTRSAPYSVIGTEYRGTQTNALSNHEGVITWPPSELK